MISRKLYVTIVIHVLLIAGLSLLCGYVILHFHSIKYAIVIAAAITAITANLIYYLNRTNRNIRFFFDSIKNNDSSLSFSVEDRSAGLGELYESMNRVNKQIQQLKIQNSKQEQYFSWILEHLATGIVTYDKKGFIHHANTAAKKLLSVETFTHIQQLERLDSKLFSVLKNLGPFERRLIGTESANGEIQLSLKSTSFGSDDNELIILSVQDIKHELDEKEVESWMKLIRVLMHEIMNSITPITSLSDSLTLIYMSGDNAIKPEYIDERKIATTLQGLKVISDQGKGLMNFVDSYRKLTRLPRPELKDIKISDIFNRVKILTGSFDNLKNIEILFDQAKGDINIFADENLISLVLINLIKNAIEANENNESAVVSIAAKVDKEGHTEICVADNGPGIAAENLDKIFIPFFTTRPNGSGIGLSLSRQIMSAHGGTLRVRSVPGKETVFCMTFRR